MPGQNNVTTVFGQVTQALADDGTNSLDKKFVFSVKEKPDTFAEGRVEGSARPRNIQ
jgi:hypothetical protein